MSYSEKVRHIILTSVHGCSSLHEKVCLQVHCVMPRALQLLFSVLFIQSDIFRFNCFDGTKLCTFIIYREQFCVHICYKPIITVL